MITICIVIPIILIAVKFLLYIISRKFGKFSYDGISVAGFSYNAEKDIFYSTKNAWQKNFGYTHTYDVMAPLFNMIIDTEPIRFYYDNKNWLITFWKGQYGIVSGAEIGVYYTNQQKVNKKTLYLPVEDRDMLEIDMILYKDGVKVTRVYAKHWWLTIFKLGMFSKPKELEMDINITFPNKDMLKAFLEAFHKKGYNDNDYRVVDNTFCFYYKKPKTRKVWTRIWIVDVIRQRINKYNVELYNKCFSDFIENNKIDDSINSNSSKLIMIDDFIPELLKTHDKNELNKNEQIINGVYNKETKNIVFLDNRVFSNIK